MGLVMAVALHVGVLAAGLYQWSATPPVSEITHAVPVDLVIAKETNVAAQVPPPDKLDIPKPDIPQPPEPQLADIEPAPEPPVPQFKIKPANTDTDNQDKDSKAPAKDFAALLNKLAAPAAAPKNAKVAPRTVQGTGAANMATASLVDALRSQIGECWSPPVGAPNANDLVVVFLLRLNRNGTVAGLQLAPETIARATSNPYTRAAAEAASRAIYECQKTGYRLPPERFSEWSDIKLNMDPRQMMGQ